MKKAAQEEVSPRLVFDQVDFAYRRGQPVYIAGTVLAGGQLRRNRSIWTAFLWHNRPEGMISRIPKALTGYRLISN